jgi:ankyrin repeat protein
MAVYRNTEPEDKTLTSMSRSAQDPPKIGLTPWLHSRDTYRRYTCMQAFPSLNTAVKALVVSLLLHASLQAAASSLIDATIAEDVATVRTLLKGTADANVAASDGTTPLHWAVRAENLELINLLIAAKANVRAADRYGVTPLYLAGSLANAVIAERLLVAGADANVLDQSGETLLSLATRMGAPDVVTALLNHGAMVNAKMQDWESTALMVAIRENESAIVKILLDHGADINARTKTGQQPARRPAGAGGGSHGVGIIRSGIPENGSQAPTQGGFTPLLYAARDGRIDMVQSLVAKGANLELPDANGITPLQMAIANENIALARYLLDRGANPNSKDAYGRTPLWLAVEVRNVEIGPSGIEHTNSVDRAVALELIRDLIKRGANVNARTTDWPPTRRHLMRLGDLSWVNFIGQTPFLRAAFSGDVTVMKLLLENGADPKIETVEGTTPLMAAAGINWVVAQSYTESEAASLEAVRLCLDLGADVNHANSMGLTAVHGAANRGSDSIIQFLADHGASMTAKDKEGRTPYVWAEGVFLATNAPVARPSSMALIKKLTGEK